jgi:DNA polymerase
MKQDTIQKEMNRLDEGIRRCRRCVLHRSRKHAVPGEGPIEAKILFVGEAPGREEDMCGRPFVGRSGRFLDGLLEEASLSRCDIYITSAVKCRPPRNRTPRTDELRICKANWLDRQIRLIRPKMIVLLGKTSVRQVLGLKGNLSRLHGQIFLQNGIRCLVTFHPAAGMRFPRIKSQMIHDFKKLMFRPLKTIP